MSLWTRISNVFRANANALIGQMEDPLKLADLTISEMLEKERRGRQKLLQIDAFIRLAEKQNHSQNDSAHIKQMRTNSDALMQSLDHLRTQIQEAKKRRHAMYIQLQKQKMQTRQLGQNRPIHVSAVFDASTLDTYDRMADKIDQLEAEAAALSELAEMDRKKPAPKPEHDEIIEGEFEEIKKR